MALNHELLEQRLAVLRANKALPGAHVDALAKVLRADDDWACFRINPMAFGEAHGLSTREAIDLFLHASRAGLLEIRFNLICPGCGSVEHQLRSMDLVPSHVWFCVVCQRDIEAELDDRVEVSFSVELGVRDLQLRVYESLANYARYYFTENVVRAPETKQLVDSLQLGLVTAAAGGVAPFEFDAVAGNTYRLLSLDNHSQVLLPTADGGARTLEVASSEEAIKPDRVTIAPGRVSVSIVNRSASRVGVLAMRVDTQRVMETVTRHPNHFRPFLTARSLLNNQTFRELYRVHTLDVNMRLRLRSLTLLFTDLKGSTELYDRTGDIRAYTFVREHFKLLADAVRRNNGAMIKTMGDAIMASFDEPTHAARAAVEMMRGMDALNANLKAEGHDTGLKIGLHEGPALAVNSDERLDYFGQTVNVAARVQGLAQAGEIWLTPSVMNAPGVAGALVEAGWASEEKDVSLKGVGGNTRVFRLHARV
jgi:class 3 adenylate cyclase